MNAVTHAHRMSERTARMQTTPAGIKIGIATVPHMRIDMTADALRLQAALLAKPKTADALVGWALAACGLALAVMAVFGWLPGA